MMAIDVADNGIALKDVEILLPVVQIVEQGVMVDRENMLAAGRLFGQSLFEPFQIFGADKTVAHLEKWAAVQTDYHERVKVDNKLVVAPQADEIACGALTPVVFMIARNERKGMSDAVEDGFDIDELAIKTFIGQIAADYDKVAG